MTNQEARATLANLEAAYRDLDPSILIDDDTIQLVSKRIEAIGVAISALEKQIPKKPIRNVGHINPAWVEDAYLCPICFSRAGSIGFCSRCGQAIDIDREGK